MTIKANQSGSMEELNMNLLGNFSCAKRDGETKRSFIKLFVLLYFIFIAVALFVHFIVARNIHLGLGTFMMGLFYAVLLSALSFKRIRRYTIDYQNNIIADMGSNQEIIPSQEIAGVEIVDRKRSFELVQSCKYGQYIGNYKTKENKTIKVCAASRDHFVLIKTKTVPNIVISPEEPEKFVEYMTGRLSYSPDKTRDDTHKI